CLSVPSRGALSTSHSLTVLSPLPVTSLLPSGLKVRARILSVWACQMRDKVCPPSSQRRTSPRLLVAAQYCPLGLMATPEMASKVEVQTHSRIMAPERVESCNSTPCK